MRQTIRAGVGDLGNWARQRCRSDVAVRSLLSSISGCALMLVGRGITTGCAFRESWGSVQRWAVALGCAEIEVADDIAPYSKAIEETAKATGKALDLVRDGTQAISRPVAQIYGLLIGDKIDASRERNLDAISRETRKILIGRDLAETAPVAEQIAIPLLEAARGETRKEMQALWAQLLANAMDPARRDDVRPEFIRYLEQFHRSEERRVGKECRP